MKKREPATKREFAVTIRFDSNRFEHEHLNTVYELILPTISEKTESKSLAPKSSASNSRHVQIQMQIFPAAATVNS